jgi:preprotein translocase subunit SecD
MNKYPLWKYLLVLAVVVFSFVYALPNIYPPDPAVQVTGQSSGLEIDQRTLNRVLSALDEDEIAYIGEEVSEDGNSALVRLADDQDQLRAKDSIQRAMGFDFIVALNQAPTTPQWLQDIGAQPMKLGLDLRGGVHFLMEVNLEAAVAGRLEGVSSQIRTLLREAGIRYLTAPELDGRVLEVGFRSASDRSEGRDILAEQFPLMLISQSEQGEAYNLELQFSDADLFDIEERALEQNLTSLKNRVNELGVAEPLVQRQGRNRIVVELPGIQDTAEAKRIIGKTANLEFRLEYDPNSPELREEFEYLNDGAGFGSAFLEVDHIVTGEEVSDASTGFDEAGAPQVNITLSSEGGAEMHRATRNAIGRRMGVLFLEEKSETTYEEVNGELVPVVETYTDRKIISLATIQSALGVTFRITGVGSQGEASELALLLRAGAFAAPMTFVEERVIGPSLGAENIRAGVSSVQLGLLLVVLFMFAYYRVFGLVANIALGVNLLLLAAIMSMLGATLTLPGIAGIVLTLGMAVDANVLIFSRIREELKNGHPPQSAIKMGYENAFSTIVDANLTTLIVAAILYLIGSGPVQGFAVTLCIGILTSMFTAIVCSRALVNLIYGTRPQVQKIWI